MHSKISYLKINIYNYIEVCEEIGPYNLFAYRKWQMQDLFTFNLLIKFILLHPLIVDRKVQ